MPVIEKSEVYHVGPEETPVLIEEPQLPLKRSIREQNDEPALLKRQNALSATSDGEKDEKSDKRSEASYAFLGDAESLPGAFAQSLCNIATDIQEDFSARSQHLVYDEERSITIEPSSPESKVE